MVVGGGGGGRGGGGCGFGCRKGASLKKKSSRGVGRRAQRLPPNAGDFAAHSHVPVSLSQL